jgi:flagellar basal-body rod modification protein FlgD
MLDAMNMMNGMQGGASGHSDKQELGQGDFLRLMIAQLRNQDPMKPMENGEFLGQMAQFSTVSGIESLNQTMSSVTGALAANQALQAATLVERNALVAADSISIDGQDSISGVISLPPDVSHGVVSIRDNSGTEVARVAVENDGSGRARFEWSGDGPDGLPPGNYQIAAEYQSGSNTRSAPTFLWGRIDSVSLFGGAGGMHMTLAGLGTISLSEALEIS